MSWGWADFAIKMSGIAKIIAFKLLAGNLVGFPANTAGVLFDLPKGGKNVEQDLKW